MPFGNTIRSLPQVYKNSKSVVRQGLTTLRRDIAIAIYPLFVFLLVLASLAVVNSLILSTTDAIAGDPLFNSDQYLARLVFGMVAVVAFYLYLAIMTGVFTCTIAASVMAELDGHPTPLLKGGRVVLENLTRIARFAALSILFLPLGLLAQRGKAHRKPHDVIGSSLSLSMAQLAPAILSGKKGVFNTILHSMDVMGQSWKENILIKVWMYSLVIIIGFISFLPGLIERWWIADASADEASWLISALLFVSLLMATRVFTSVFTATIYWRTIKDPKK